MYVVTRTFRDSNGVFSVGSIIEPTEVKTFKSRLQQKHIVDVNEQNIERWATFFKNRYGIDLRDTFAAYIAGAVSEDAPVDEPQVSTESVKQDSDW